MSYYIGGAQFGDDHLAHYGVLGMKWGIRRYENPDGTLTAAGKKKYGEQGKYTYTSYMTKSFKRSADKFEDRANAADKHGSLNKAAQLRKKAANMREYENRSRTVDSRMEQYARNTSVGKNLLSRALTFGIVGSRTYTQTLASIGGQDDTNLGKKFLATGITAAAWTLPYGMMAQSLITRMRKPD